MPKSPLRNSHGSATLAIASLETGSKALAIVLAFVSACAFANAAAADRAALERLVREDCGACHGMTLKGGLGPDIRGKALAGRGREALAGVILDGLPGTAMPPWRPLLSEDEALWIADYLLTRADP